MKPDSFQPPVPQRPAPRKVFDVMRPGRAPASSTSKPVIVSHKPMIQDNSVTTNGVGEPRQLLNSRLKIAVKPADDEGSTPVTVTAPAPSMPQQAPAPPPVAPVAPRAHVPFATAVAPATPAESPAPMPVPVTPTAPAPPAPVETLAPAETHDDLHDDLAIPQFQADAGHDDPLLDDMPQPVTDSEEPVISKQIGPKTFPWKTTILISIIILLAVVVIDVLLDGDFISWGIPHTHFF